MAGKRRYGWWPKWLPSLRDSGPPRLWRIGYALAVSVTVTLAGLGLLWWAVLAILNYPRLPHSRSLSLHDTVGVLQLVFASVAGAGALVALIVAYRRQRVAETGSAYDRTRAFNERFTAIAGQLGEDQAAVRLAGVHAMAGLADDWEENRQTCIDVLCAYLRMPYEPDPGKDAPAAERLAFGANREVRHTVIRIITAHLRRGAAASWQGLNFDFTGVQFDGGEFTGAVFSSGIVRFTGVEFYGGTVDFGGAMFSGGTVDFNLAVFSGGDVSFGGAAFSGGTVSFGGAAFSGGMIDFGGAMISGGDVGFGGATFSGGTVSFGGAMISGGQVSFGGATFSGGTVGFGLAGFSGGTVSFGGAVFSGGQVSFGLAGFSSNAVVSFWSAEFSGGVVYLGGAMFSGGTIDFSLAVFSGGEVDFGEPRDWSHPPSFDFTGAPPPGVKLPDGPVA